MNENEDLPETDTLNETVPAEVRADLEADRAEPTVPAKKPTYGFDYKNIRLKDLQLEVAMPNEVDPAVQYALREAGGNMPVHGGKLVTKVIVDGEPFTPTGRFWGSLYSRFQLNTAFFKFFEHQEVFSRISEIDKNDRIRVGIERNKDTGDSRLLAATGLNKPVVVYDDLLDILRAFQTDEGGVRYHNGVVVSTHTPRIGQSQFKICGDQFSNKYELHCPVDGYGGPEVYLSLLRWICSNGAVAFAKAFKTSLALGSGADNVRFTIQRALDSFTNDEGYAMLRGRFELAAHSWASIREHQDLYRVILGLQNDAVLAETAKDWRKADSNDLAISPGNALMKAYDRFLGDPYKLYSSDPNLMSQKRQRTLPMSAKVYDLFNFATELATHHVSERGARQLQAWVGGMLSNDYDLEESCDQFADFRDLFLSNLQAEAGEGRPHRTPPDQRLTLTLSPRKEPNDARPEPTVRPAAADLRPAGGGPGARRDRHQAELHGGPDPGQHDPDQEQGDRHPNGRRAAALPARDPRAGRRGPRPAAEPPGPVRRE